MCQIVEGVDGKVCTKCKKLKGFGEFYKNKNSKDGHAWACKVCCKNIKEQIERKKKEGLYLSLAQKADNRILFNASKINIRRLKKIRIGKNSGGLWECNICKYQWETRNCCINAGSGCPKCAGNAKRNNSERIVAIHKKHGNSIKILKIIEGSGTKALAQVKCLSCNKIGNATLRDLEYEPSTEKHGSSAFKCNCFISSYIEVVAKCWFENQKIKYEEQRQFDDLINPKTNFKLKYDFFVEQKFLLELDGRQHIDTNDKWHNEGVVYRDKLKNVYAQKNEIKLIRIPHTQFNKIHEVLEQHFGHLAKE